MILADIRPYVTLDPEEAQLNEGGLNEWDNCGAADYALKLKWLGNGDPFEPEQIMEMIHFPGYHGGEVSPNLIAFFNKHRDKYPKLPTITVEQGGDIITRSIAALRAGFPITNWWWCNTNGDIQSRNTGILHWSGAVYVTDKAIGIFNIMRGQLVELSYAAARAAYVGEFTTFHASVFAVKIQEEDDMFVWAPTNKTTYVPVDAESERFGHGYPGRDIYIKLCRDRDFGPTDTVLDVLFVGADFETHPTLKDRKTVILHGSSMQTLAVPDKWDGMVVIKSANGGTYYGAVKTEYRS